MADLSLLWTALAGAATSMIVGMIWYGPLLGKPWMKAMGWSDLSEDQIKQKQKGAMPGYLMSMAWAAAVSVFIHAVLFRWDFYTLMGSMSEPVAGLFIGAVGWAAFWLPAAKVATFFEGNWPLFMISGGFWLIQYSLYGLWAGLFHSL